MKITKKITSVVLALLLAVSAFAGLAITANAAAPTSATLTIHKYDVDENNNTTTAVGNTGTLTGTTADAPASGTPLQGAEFTIYYQGPLGTATPATPDTATTTKDVKTTNENGEAVFTIDGTTLPTGLYYVVETSSPAKVTTKATSFYVSLPMTTQNATPADNNGVTWNSDVHVYPKNLTTLGGATLTKTINNAAITASTTLAVAPKFQLVEYKDNTVGTIIAGDIEAKAGYNAVTNITADDKYATVTIAQKDGVIAVDGLPVGTYAFIETDAAQIVAGTDLPIDSAPRIFTVAQGYNVDVTTAETGFGTISKITAGDAATYTFTVDNSTEPTVSKTVDKTDASIGENVTWTITPVVPADIATYQTYKVTDTIDSCLNISGTDAVTVKLDGTAYTGAAVTVVDKLVTVDFADKFADLEGKTLTIEIVTQINATAVADAAIKNKATLTYKNSFQTTDKTTDSNEPETTTGAFKIEKVDASNTETKLANVEFELTTLDGEAVNVSYDDTNKIYVVDPTSTSNKVVTATDGTVYVKGLAYDTYTLTETKTNNGYQLSLTPTSVTVNKGTGETAVVIKNVKQPDLPLTGGMGTILFTVAGLALIGGAAFFFIRSRKSKKEEA